MRCTLPAVRVAVAIVVVVFAIAVAMMLRHGFSARDEPTMIERVVARSARHFATPSSLRDARNPVALTPQVLAEARAHFADHCASCHANDGSGDTEIGRNLYPKAPDMRQRETQTLSDGELFAIIRNGVRLTGMPGWGGNDADNWKLVHFIRHLPKLTPQELVEMKAMNPISPMEMKEREEEEKFLAGDSRAR